MNGGTRFSRIALIGLCVFVSGIAPAAAQEEARPSPKAIGDGLKSRRAALLQLEGSVQDLRDEVKLQMADAVAGQQPAIDRAGKELRVARTAREEAEYALQEYVQGIFLQDQATCRGQIALAKIDVELSQESLKSLERRRDKGEHVDPNRIISLQLTCQQAEFDLEQAETQLKVLVEYTKDKEIKAREKAIEATKAVEAEKEVLVSTERAKQAKYSDLAGRLKVRSPEDLVLALIDDAINLEGKVVAVVGDLQKIESRVRDKPGDAATLAPQLAAKKAEADSLMAQAKARLLDAAHLGERLKALRSRLREAEAGLKRERELMDRLERELTPPRS